MLAKRQQCYSCKRNVYSSEKVDANGRIFHQGCLKCEECGVALTPKGLKKLNGTYYCKEHHQKNLFAPRPQANDEDDKDDKKQAAMVGAAANGAKKKKVSIELPTSDDSSTQSSSSAKERSISFSDVVEASSGITVSGTFLTVSGLSGKKDKKAAKKQSKEAEKQKKKEEKEQAGYMRKRSSSFSGVTSGIINLVSSGGGVFKTRSRDAHSFEQDKIVEMAESSGSVEVDDNNDDSDEADEKKLALQKKIEEMKKRNEQWMKRIENEIGRKKSAKNEESESEASDSDIDTSDITFTTEQDATEISDGESDTELSETSDNESDDEAEVQRLLREREEELKRKREEIKRKEEEMQRKLEEMKRKEEEVLRKEEELKKKEEERMRRKKEKQQQRKKEKLAAALNKPDEDEELKQIEEEMRKQEEELRKVEEKIRLKEAKLKEKERRMLLEASGSAEVVGLVAGPAEDKADATADDDEAKKQKREMWMKEIDEEVERRRKDKKASQGGDAEEKVVAKTEPTKRTSGDPSRRKRELLALLNSDSDDGQEDGESTKEASPSSDDSQSEGAGQEMRDELVARCTYVWALDKQKKEEEEKKKREEDAKDAAQRERDGEQQRREALKKKEEERERKQKEEEWERMQQRVEEELRLEEAKKRVEEERRLREQTLKRRNEAWFRKMEEEMAAREETLRQLREAEEKQKAAENDQRRAMGLPPLVESSDSNTSSSSLKYDDSDKSVDIVVAAAALGASPKRVLSKPMIPRKPLPPTPLMERERKAGSDLAGELASRRAKGISWDSMAGDMVKVSVAAGPIVHERRSSVDSGSAAAKKASSGARRVSDVDAALDAADRKAAKASKRQSVEGVLGKASKKPLLLLRPAVALRNGPKDKKAKKQKKDMEKIMKKRKKLQKKGANALVNEERPQCLYGDGCKSLDPDHWVVFQHTPVEKREEEMKSKAEKEARRRAKGKERVSTDEDEDEAEREREREEERERRLAAQRRGEESSDSVRALEEEMLKNGDTQDEEAWKVMRKQLARERERKMELAEIEREKTALLTERKRIEFEMSSIRAERKQIEEESRSRIDVRSREKQQEREANNRGRVGKGVAAAQPKTRQAHVQERNNFYMQKLQNIKDKKPQQQQPATPQKKSAGVKSPQQKARASATKNGVARVNPADGARKPGSKKLPAVPRSSSSSSSASSSPAKSSPSSSPSSKSSPASSPLKSLPSGPRSRKEVMKLRESEMMANTKFMAKALQSYKSSDKKHLSFPRGASVRVLVVNEEEGMLYGCCNKKSRPLFVNLTVHRMSFTFTAALTASGKESPGALDSSQPSVIQSPPSYPGQHSSPFLAAAWPGPEHPPSLHSPPLHPPPPYNLEFDPIYHCTSTSPVSAPISNFCYAAGLPPAASFCLPPFEQSHCAIPERSNIMWNEQLGARDNNHIDDDAFVNAFFRRSQPSFPASSSSSSASFPAATTTSSWQQQLSPPPSATTSAATTMATSASFHSQASDWSPAYRLDQRASTQLRHGRDPRQRSVGDTTSHHPAPANTGRTPPSLMAATGGDSCQAAFNTGFQSCYPSSTTLPPPQAAAMLPPPLVRSNEAEARTSLPRLAPRRALAAIAPRPPVPVVPTTATSTSTTFLPHRGHNAGARLPGPLPPSPAPWQPTQKPRSKNAAEQLSGISTTTTTMSTVITFVTSSPPSSTTSAAGRRASAAQARSMDAMTTAPTGKKRATRQPRKTHARIYKWKLWTGDTHLQYFTQFSRLASAFEESIWAYTVMHPSVMHEDTLRMSLQHNEEGESDPLLFNVNVLVALAARLIGDRNTQKEFYHRARTQLADLFDCQSVEVAEGLSAMSYYALGEADFNQFSYYNTLSLRMCQQLGAYHTDAFSRSFYVFLLDPSNSFHAKMALVKSLASLGPSGPRLPISALAAFYHSCPEISPPSSPLASTAAPPSSPPADDPYAQYLYTRVSHIQNEEQRRKMYSQLRKSTIMATYTTNCTFLLAAYKGRQQQESQLPPAPAAPGAAAHRRTGPGSDDLYGQLLENLDFYEADLAGLEECGMAARLTSTLAWAALKTEVHWEAGQRDLARQSAQRFVKEVESFRSDICSLSCTSSMRFANVCSILLQCGEAETLRYLLELVEPWARGFTLASQITTKFKNLLPPPTQRGNKRQSSK